MTYTVRLESFSGPLDLLLYLVKQEEVEIHEIPIARICDMYLVHLKEIAELDVENASEFLVMAATLMLIKSRALLPDEEAVDLEEELDPKDELIQQLLEYKRFKMAARDLSALASERSRRIAFTPPEDGREREIPLEDIDLFDLVKAFAQLLKATGLDHAPRVIANEKPLREYIDDVFAIVREKKSVTFAQLFEGQTDRVTLIGRLLALLELVRRRRLAVKQIGTFDQIEIELRDESALTDDEYNDADLALTSAPEIDAEPLGSDALEAPESPEEPEAAQELSETVDLPQASEAPAPEEFGAGEAGEPGHG